MRLEFYITDLLFRHDCVIVPELGAFVSQSYPAELEPSTRMFRPARKQLAFNSEMRRSDGLLIDYVATTNAWSFERASQELKKAVRHWRHELAQGKKIRLEYIGQLYTENGSIQFLPSLESNYQLDSYGMGMFYVHPINALKSPAQSKTKKKPKEKKKSPCLMPPEQLLGGNGDGQRYSFRFWLQAVSYGRKSRKCDSS